MFIEVTVVRQRLWHGYDDAGREILEEGEPGPPQTKLVALSRVQSVGQQYLLVSSGFGRQAYWEHADGYEVLKQRIADALGSAAAADAPPHPPA